MALDMNALFNVGTSPVKPFKADNSLFGGAGLFDEPAKATTVIAELPKEVKPEPVAEQAAEAEDPAPEPVQTTTPKAKKAKKAVESAAEEDQVTFINAKHEPQKVSITALKKVFTCSFEDPQWETVKTDLQERAKNVKIEPDLTYGATRVLLAQTTNLISDLLAVQSENKKFYDRLCDKAIGLIPRQEQLNACGKNEADRKRNSILSCEDFVVTGKDGKGYNLFDIAGVLFDRIAVIESLLNDVKQKKETLVSFLAIFKLEASAK